MTSRPKKQIQQETERSFQDALYQGDYAMQYLEIMQVTIQRGIDSTPTGPSRNVLCDANIYLLSAIADLNKAKDLLTKFHQG